jgi:predicted transcriptional regulator
MGTVATGLTTRPMYDETGKHGCRRVTFKPTQHKLTIAMIDRLEKEVDMLERHLQVLRMVIENEPIGIVKMSNETGYPHHKVRYSLRVLEEENLIEPSSQGAITTEQTGEFVDDLDEKIDEIIDKLEGMKIDDAAEIES